MKQENFKIYGYRWVMLLVYMFIVAVNQMLWITFAPITGDSALFFKVDDLSIGLLSMVFMIVFIFVAVPASWAIDTWGIRKAVGLGAVLTAVFGLMRGLAGSNYTLVMIAQVGIAIGQPFLLNAVTSVAARWFPVNERATASGMGSLAIYLGIFLGLVLTPYLALHFSIASMLLVYGIVSVIAAIVFLVFSRERPLTPPCPPEMEVRSLVFDGLKQMMRSGNFILLLVIFFIGLGVFNAVTTWIEDIVRPSGISSTQAGVIGGLMIAGGIVGALVLPSISDRMRRRTPFILIALAGATLGLAGIAFFTSYSLLLVASFIMGFFLLSSGPIGFQYGAESTHPAPEGTSNGLLILMGQISGIAFIFAMDSLKAPDTGSMSFPLVILLGLMVVAFVLAFFLKEPKIFLTGEANPKK